MTKNFLINILLVLACLLPAVTNAQQEDITGIWNGHLELLDSANNIVKLPFEIAVSEEKGKLFGYSRIIFHANGKDEAGMQDITIQRKGKDIIIEDEGFIEHDFTINPSRRVKKTMVMTLAVIDTQMLMEGKWSTNRTRAYLQMKGDAVLKRKVEFKSTAIFKRLDTLKLAEKLSFKDRPETAPTVAVVTAPEKKPVVAPAPIPEPVPEPELIIPAIAKATFDLQPVVKKAQQSTAKVSPPSPQKRALYNAISKSTLKYVPKEIEPEPVTVAAAPKPKPAPVVAAPKPQPVVTKPIKEPTPVVVAAPVSPPVQKPVPQPVVIAPSVTQGAAEIEKRTTKSDQIFYFEKDSLVLTLYDNGEVDGDTVTVLMNGGIIFSKQGLTTQPNTKTVYIPANSDSVNLVMYAESLGEIPPNTGLMIIMDGEKRYEVRFSADLKSNAGIILRRRKKL